MQYKIQDLPGASGIEHFLANVSHYSLYGFMTIMPASGIAMGYFGGTELEFCVCDPFPLLDTVLIPGISILFHFFLYFSGKGLPFFTTTIPGIVKTDDNKKTTGMIAKNSFFIHKQLGVYGKCLLSITSRSSMHFMIHFPSPA